jgi:hypothetical protein
MCYSYYNKLIFVTRVDPDIFDGIAWFRRNKRCFVADDKLFLQKSLRTHFSNLGSLEWGLYFCSR